jgi:hypothetical protein
LAESLPNNKVQRTTQANTIQNYERPAMILRLVIFGSAMVETFAHGQILFNINVYYRSGQTLEISNRAFLRSATDYSQCAIFYLHFHYLLMPSTRHPSRSDE